MILAALLLGLAAVPQTDATDFDRDNVVILLDASGSMRDPLPGSRGSRMDAAKDAIRRVLKTVPADTQVGLLVFSGRNKPRDWIYPLGPRDDGALVDGMQQVQASGKTPLGRYLKAAADSLLTQRDAQNGYGSFRLLVVTDGQATDKDVLAAYLPDVLRRGIVMDVIGVAMDEEHDLANKVHTYRRADDQQALSEALTEVFAEVGSQGAADLAADFELLDALPDGAVQELIDAVAVRNDEPIGRVRVRTRDGDVVSETVSYGNGSGGGLGFGFFAGISGLLCFAGLVIGVTVFFKIVRALKK